MFDYMMTKEQIKIRDEARDLVKWVPRQMILDMDTDKIKFPKEFLQEAARRNLLGCRYPQKWGGRDMDWFEEGLTYHEATGVLSEGSLRVWDSTRGVWRASSETQGYGSIAAIRCWLPRESAVSWGANSLKSGLWCELA